MSGSVIELNEETFDEAVKAAKPVMVDFWAPWCGPCRMIAPVLEELGTEYGENAVIAKVNVDENPNLAARFGVTSIPNLKVFKAGEEVENLIGAAPKASLKSAIDKHI